MQKFEEAQNAISRAEEEANKNIFNQVDNSAKGWREKTARGLNNQHGSASFAIGMKTNNTKGQIGQGKQSNQSASPAKKLSNNVANQSKNVSNNFGIGSHSFF